MFLSFLSRGDKALNQSREACQQRLKTAARHNVPTGRPPPLPCLKIIQSYTFPADKHPILDDHPSSRCVKKVLLYPALVEESRKTNEERVLSIFWNTCIAMNIRKTCLYCGGPKHSSWGPWTLLVTMKMLRRRIMRGLNEPMHIRTGCLRVSWHPSIHFHQGVQSWGVGKGKTWERRARGIRKANTADCSEEPYH